MTSSSPTISNLDDPFDESEDEAAPPAAPPSSDMAVGVLMMLRLLPLPDEEDEDEDPSLVREHSISSCDLSSALCEERQRICSWNREQAYTLTKTSHLQPANLRSFKFVL